MTQDKQHPVSWTLMHMDSEFDEDENVAGQEPACKRSKTVPATARRNSLEQKVSSSSASQRGRSWNRRRTTNSRRTNSNPRFHWQLSSVQEGTTTGFSPAASHAASRGLCLLYHQNQHQQSCRNRSLNRGHLHLNLMNSLLGGHGRILILIFSEC